MGFVMEGGGGVVSFLVFFFFMYRPSPWIGRSEDEHQFFESHLRVFFFFFLLLREHGARIENQIP